MPEWWQIKDSLDIPEVLDNLGISVTRVDGDEHFASCPLPSHPGDDANPSFSVNDTKLVYSCFACSGGGMVPNLVMDLESLTWDEALDWLAEYSDAIAADEADAFTRQIEMLIHEKEEEPEPEPLPWFSPKKIAQWTKNETDWFEGRGISDETRELFNLGFDPEHMRKTSSIDEPYHGPAVIIPHFFNGRLCGWQERWLDEDRPKWIGKYTNSSGFPKKYTLYNYDSSIKESEVIVVEGTLTAVRLIQLGYNAVGTFGAKVTDQQWNMLSGFQKVYLSFDNDDAGYKAQESGLTKLGRRTDVWVIDPPTNQKGADLADVSDDEIPSFIEAAQPGFMRM